MASVKGPERQQLMSDMMTSDNNVGLRRIKTATLSQQELQTANGRYFSGRTVRDNVTASPTTVYYSLLRTGARYVIMEEVFQTIDYSQITNGNFSHVLDIFFSGSDINSWDYTNGAFLPAGRNMNFESINELPTATVSLGGSVTNLTGQPDHTLFDSNFYIDTGGNRNIQTISGDNFFRKGREVIIPPDSDVLIRATSSGTAIEGASVKTLFFFDELDKDEIGGSV